jgi:hypothetical protein
LTQRYLGQHAGDEVEEESWTGQCFETLTKAGQYCDEEVGLSMQEDHFAVEGMAADTRTSGPA